MSSIILTSIEIPGCFHCLAGQGVKNLITPGNSLHECKGSLAVCLIPKQTWTLKSNQVIWSLSMAQPDNTQMGEEAVVHTRI